MSNTVNLDDTNFDSVITDSNTPVLVDFYATWCGPCKKMEPILQTFASENSGRVTVGKLDVDLAPDIANRYNIRSLPTVLLFRDGKVTGQVTGIANVQKLTGLLEG
jgi:thioredoxin 1